MPIFLYIIFLLSCFQSTLLQSGSPGCLVFDDTLFDTGVLRSVPPSYESIPLAPAPILGLHEEITDTKAFDCYKLYEKELNGKSQWQLTWSLVRCLNQPDCNRSLYREKMVALLIAGAESQNTNFETPLRNAIVHDDIPLARYICTYYPEDLNRLLSKHNVFGVSCKSPEMAQLMVTHGANLDAKPSDGLTSSEQGPIQE